LVIIAIITYITAAATTTNTKSGSY